MLILIPFSMNAQDIHFSQYLSAPFNLNPAFTGSFNGDYRLIGNYRNQWNSVTVPYLTYGVSGDVSKFMGMNDFGLGASIYYDQAGDGEMNTLIVQLSGSYAYPLTKDSAHKLVFGLQPSYGRQEVNYSKLNFDNQYNDQIGKYDPTLSSGEQFDKSNINWVTLGAGLRWQYKMSPRNKIDIGIAGYNLTKPKINYSVDDNRLEQRMNFHGNIQVKTFEKLDVIPGFLYTSQGSSSELLMGASARYIYNGYTAFHLGYWYRNKDAGFMSVGLTFQSLYFGLSYDINTSKLSEASRGRGAFELSLIYIMRKFKPKDGKYLSCPNYL